MDNGEKNVEVWCKATIAHTQKKVYGGNERDRGVTEKEVQKHNDQEQELYVGHR